MHLKELLDLGIIRPSVSPWGAPVIFCEEEEKFLMIIHRLQGFELSHIEEYVPNTLHR